MIPFVRPEGPLLTVGIPTYNRATTLRACLARLLVNLEPHAAYVEVIVSDNASDDDTDRVLSECRDLWRDRVHLRCIRQGSNVGVSRNVVSLFYAAATPYFMFLGDDDCLSPTALPGLLALLESAAPPVAVIQACWQGRLRKPPTPDATWEEALDLLYEYGNAWAGVIDVRAARRAVDDRGIRAGIEEIVWPQTVLGFLAMHDSRPRPICLFGDELGLPLVPGLNIHSKAYWIRSLGDLLRAATIIDTATGGSRARKALSSPFNTGLPGHVRSIAWEALLEEGGPSTRQLRSQLRNDFGLRGWPWSMALALTDSPRALRVVARSIALLVRGLPRHRFDELLAARKHARFAEIADAGRSKRRFGDWF